MVVIGRLIRRDSDVEEIGRLLRRDRDMVY